MFQIARIVFRYCPAPDGSACAVNRIAISANEIMPIRQWLVLGAQHISAGFWKPVHRLELCRSQSDAFGHIGMAVLIVRTTSAVPIQQAARDIGGMQFPRILIFKFVDAAFAATVAQGLPLRPIKPGQRHVLPETPAHLTQRPSSRAISSGEPLSGMKAIGSPSGPYKAVARL